MPQLWEHDFDHEGGIARDLSLPRSRSPSNAASNIRTAIQSRVCGQSSAPASWQVSSKTVMRSSNSSGVNGDRLMTSLSSQMGMLARASLLLTTKCCENEATI